MKEAVSIPLIRNGDVVTIGQVVLGNPWMIYRTVQYLKIGELMELERVVFGVSAV